MDITGASAIVTGGASGLGEATARLLAQRGARVVVLDLQEAPGEKLAAEIGGVFAKADVADEEQVKAAVEAASELGPLRILVNSAGLGRAGRIIGRDLAPIPLEQFEFVLRVNLVGSYNCARLAASAMATTEPLADGTSRGTASASTPSHPVWSTRRSTAPARRPRHSRPSSVRASCTPTGSARPRSSPPWPSRSSPTTT